MRIAKNPGDSLERGDFFRGALGIASGDSNARSGILAVAGAEGTVGLRALVLADGTVRDVEVVSGGGR